MKRVDESYSYNELEGFAAVSLKTAARQDELWLCTLMDSRGFRLSRAARKILCVKSCIRVFYNPDTKELLLAASNEDADNSVRVTKSATTCLNSGKLCRMIYQLCRFDESTVVVRIPGTAARSRKNAIIFDLSAAKSEKPKKGNRK